MIINKNYKLESNSLNIILLERGKSKRTGLPRYEPIGYFRTPQSALEFLADHKIRGTGFKDLETITVKQQEIYDLIDSLNLSETHCGQV